MRYFLFVLAFAIKISVDAQTYSTVYEEECKFSQQFYKEHLKKFDSISTKIKNSSGAFVFSVIAPELSQYQWLQAKIETYSNKVMYVQFGKRYGDFSIGYFQMKPSFIEAIEVFVKNEPKLIEYINAVIVNNDARQARIERIKRLENLQWQFKYLEIFLKIAEVKSDAYKNKTVTERIKRFALLYNTGFNKTDDQLNKISSLNLFPHFSLNKFNYCNVAVELYEKVK